MSPPALSPTPSPSPSAPAGQSKQSQQSSGEPRVRRPRVRFLVLGTALALVAALVLWTQGIWPQREEGQPPATAGLVTPGLELYETADRKLAPALVGPGLGLGQISTAEMTGKVVVLNVWGSWCGPCRKEAPDLARAARQFSAENVAFIGVDTRDNETAAEAFVRGFGIPYPSLFDPAGTLMLPWHDIVPLSAIPSTVVLDPQGRVAARVIGTVDYTTLTGIVGDVLAEDDLEKQGS